MCRALLYLGQPVLLDNLLYQPDSALIRQSYMPKMLHMLNLAGFGLRAWVRGDPRRPAAGFGALAGLTLRKTSTAKRRTAPPAP